MDFLKSARERKAKRAEEYATLYEELLISHYSWAVGVVMRQMSLMGMTYCRETAEEVVQDASVKIWKCTKPFHTGLPFKPYYSTVLKHALVDHYRREQRQLSESLEGSTIPEEKLDCLSLLFPGSIPDSPSVALERQERSQQLYAAIQRLSEDHRVVIKLYYFEEASQQEIAEDLGLPVETIKTRLHRARQALRRLLPEDFAVELGRAADKQEPSPTTHQLALQK